jgi:hypothetical protein
MSLFPFQPETPLSETLRFLTDIIDHIDASEQRINLRLAPRQEFNLQFSVEDTDRQRIENLLFGSAAANFDLPLWHQPLILTADAAATDVSVTVYDPANLPADLGYTTAYNDFRSGGKAMVWEDETNYELVDTLDLSTPGTIAFSAGLTNSYPSGSKIYPVLPSVILGQPRVVRHAIHLTEYTINFAITDQNVSFADDSAFSSLSGLPLLDDPNVISGTMNETWDTRITILDGRTGVFSTATRQDRARRGTAKSWVSHTRQRIWEIRQMLHFLRGRQKPFYLPTFAQDLTASQNLGSGSTHLVVVNTAYTAQTVSRNPRNLIRVGLVDGTIFYRTIVSSSVLSATEEQLVLDTTWPSLILLEDVERIDFLEKVRIDSDDITLRHNDAIGYSEVGFAVRTVIE